MYLLNSRVSFGVAMARQLLSPWCWLVGHDWRKRPPYALAEAKVCRRCALSWWAAEN